MPSASTHRKCQLDELACVHPNAAGLDIGSEEIVVAVPPDRDPQPVRVFQTFTADLHALVAWLVACGIDTVALESTGVFWIPIYELLETDRGSSAGPKRFSCHPQSAGGCDTKSPTPEQHAADHQRQ